MVSELAAPALALVASSLRATWVLGSPWARWALGPWGQLRQSATWQQFGRIPRRRLGPLPRPPPMRRWQAESGQGGCRSARARAPQAAGYPSHTPDKRLPKAG